MNNTNKYRPFLQMPYCCVPATLQSVFYRRGLDILDQETIGAYLGLRVKKDHLKYFQNPKIQVVNDGEEAMTQILKNEYSIQNLFDKLKYPLKISEEIQFSDLQEIDKFLQVKIKEDVDIILRYNNSLFQSNKKGVGHFSLISEYDDKSREVLILDPDPPFLKILKLEDLYTSISNKLDGIQRGLYIVEREF